MLPDPQQTGLSQQQAESAGGASWRDIEQRVADLQRLQQMRHWWQGHAAEDEETPVPFSELRSRLFSLSADEPLRRHFEQAIEGMQAEEQPPEQEGSEGSSFKFDCEEREGESSENDVDDDYRRDEGSEDRGAPEQGQQ